MKKLKKLLKKLKNNAGSSIVMVVVSVAFIGIIVGALLAVAVQSYRLKLQELNSRDNFYYVEQALNEIYAGVGSQTVEDLQDAYVYTVENMVEYDLVKGRYVTKSQEEAQKMFSQEFYRQLQNNPFFKVSLDDLKTKLESYVSNDTVKVNADRMQVVDYLDDDNNKVGKVIKNITLSRTQEYNRSNANGVFTQSITTDIVIGNPDFKVLFDSVEDEDPNIFKYALVADMGVEVDQPTVPLTIAGNVYAAADYYNKQYNESTWDDDVNDTDKKLVSSDTYDVEQKDGKTVNIADLYTHGSVTSKSAKGEKTSPSYTYFNKYATQTNNTEVAGTNDYYDGATIKSKYSGFYVNGSQVSIMADTVIVPGTMAVMDKGSLSIYGKNGSRTAESEVWTDNVVLDGYSTVKETTAKDGTVTTTYKGAEAILKADMYVKDDTEVNAAGASFQITGSYFGYGDSTEKDTRKFTPVVDATNFQIEVTDADGNKTTENRGHYNSSAIIVNGEQSTLNLAQAKTLFLAGRTYIELSKDVNSVDGTVREDDQVVNTVKDTYAYHPTDYDPEMPDAMRTEANKTTTIRDYKMGESISLKSNQEAYIPITYNGIPKLAKDKSGNSLGYYLAELPPALKGSTLFETYFPEAVFDGKVPCVLQEISGKKYYYYDFQTAYDQVKEYESKKLSATEYATWVNKYASAQYFAAGFIEDYDAELEMHRKYVAASNKAGLVDSAIAEYLVDIGDYEDFDAGNIILPDAELDDTVSIYSSGAITTKKDTTFSIVRADDTDALTKLLTSDSLKDMDEGNKWAGSVDASGKETQYTDAYQLSNDLEMEYEFMKWNLGHYSENPSLDSVTLANNSVEKKYIKDVVNNENLGDASITPINKFLDMSLITEKTNITPNISGGDAGTSVLDLASGYSVWVSNDDVTIKAKKEDKGEVRGVVITKGDVYFDTTAENGVTDFEGVIISGGKIYVAGNVKTITSSAEICRAVLRECMLNSDANSKFILQLFRGYEPDDKATDSDATEAKSIDMIDYTDVVSFDNWMKNVE